MTTGKNTKTIGGAFIIIIMAMGLFSFFKKQPSLEKPSAAYEEKAVATPMGPYSDTTINLIYNLLFCDDIELYKNSITSNIVYPYTKIFSKTSSPNDLQKVIDDQTVDTRARILACNQLLATGTQPTQKELFAVIVEIGLENGLDVLAAFGDGSARYINQSGKVVIWESADNQSRKLTSALFAQGEIVIPKIGKWNKPRLPFPATGNARITFLVSDGLYFGEGPIDALFSDPMAGPVLGSAAELMQYLIENAEKNEAP